MIQKSYEDEFAPAVYLIPTPIGNLQDITLRAIETLKNVDVVFCEDTRVTSLLLSHFDIKKKLYSSHKFNEEDNKEKLLSYLKEGKKVGIVSDRGTPIISDPGYTLVKIALENHYTVIGLPGPTAFVPALIMSGLSPQPFYFYGFLQSKEGKRSEELEQLKKIKDTLIFYEAPHRIMKTLNQMLEVFGNRKICIAREISKKFETIYRGTIQEVLASGEEMKGEIVLLVDGNHQPESFDHLTIIEHVNLYIKKGLKTMDAIKKVSKDRRIPKKEVYEEYHGTRRK